METSGCKKRKRGERVFKFKSFGEKGYPIEIRGSFRENVKALLEYGTLENRNALGNNGYGMCIWSFQLEVNRHPPLHILLFVVEESIEMALDRHCNHCLYVGWGENMICNKKYHFLVPSKDTLGACLGSNYEQGNNYLYNNNKNKGDINTTMGKLNNNLVELNGHIMHGVFHSNGFGHLLCINGVEMGSDLAGRHIMDFWDRLCNALQARVVSLHDIARKKSMDLRLLYGVAYGEPWFGRWGYKFGRGSFGVTQQMYINALETIQAIPLCLLGTSNYEISIIFSRYQSHSGNSMITLSDILRFMLELRTRFPKESNIDTYNPGALVESSCRWSPKRVEMAARVIVESLKKAEFRWVSRQEVRDAARVYVGDTGLLDFVLKSLGNHVVGNYLVRRCLNPVTKVLEYCLEDISGTFPNQDGFISNDHTKINSQQYKVSKVQLMKDIFYVYKHILKRPNQASSSGLFLAISQASRVILDTKKLIKEYTMEFPSINMSLGEEFKVHCTIMMTKNGRTEEEEASRTIVAPYECISLKNIVTFDELSIEVTKIFKEIYWGLKTLKIDSIVNLCAKGSDYVSNIVKVGGKVIFEGYVGDERGIIDENIYERRWKDYIVDCNCGAKEDDGERMVVCDICEIWQHTRCVGIPNNEQVPNIFLCSRCEQDIVVLPPLP